MMTRPNVAKAGDEYAVRFTGPQRALLESAILFMRDRQESDRALWTRVGSERGALTLLWEMLREAETPVLSIVDLHLIHTSLLAVCNLFSSEEDFYLKIGFFKENATALANGLVAAIGDAESTQ